MPAQQFLHLLLQRILYFLPAVRWEIKSIMFASTWNLCYFCKGVLSICSFFLVLCISSFSLMPINPIHTLLVTNSLCQPFEGGVATQKDGCKLEAENSTLESVLSLNDDGRLSLHPEEPCSAVTSDTTEAPVQIDIIRQPSPPPVLADVHDLIPNASTQVTDLTTGPEKSLQDELVRSESPLQLHIVRF